MAGRANVPSPPWPTLAFFYAIFLTTLFVVVGGLASNDSALTSGPLATVSSYFILGTAGTSSSTGWPDNDVIIDPDCDPKLAARQVKDGGDKLDCPCCISRNGTHLEPFQTVSRPDMPTDLPTTSFAGPHSMWEATVTIPGEPVPVESGLGDVDLSICVACEDEVCFLGNPNGRRQIDDSDSSDWPSSDEDEEDDDPSTPNDLMALSLTHPQTWQYGEESWWGHMYNIIINRGARFGPRLPRGKVDPRLETYSFLSHASMINFDQKDAANNIIRADGGLAGGIIPIWGCTGIVVVSDRGAYTAHIWEAPTFVTGPGRPQEDAETRQMHWDLRVNQFFAKGNRDITSPPAPALADLAKNWGPFAQGKYQWIQVHIFAVAHMNRPGPQYPEQMRLLEAELKKYLGHVDERDFSRHLYTRRAPHRDDATFFDSNEYYKERAGLQLVAWQYAPKEPSTLPAQSDKTRDMRAFRLWWNKRIMTTKTWCIPDSLDCEVPCTRDYPEADPDTKTERGGGGQASGSGSQPRRDLDIVRSPSSALSLVPRVDPPRMPREFTEMFPGALTDPRTWEYGALDWWHRMYTVAVKYGATGEPSQLLNVVSGDDYSANHCVYRDLYNLASEGTGGGVTPLFGCSGLVVASNKGVYMAHFWEQPTFWPPPPNLQARKPNLYGDEKAIWDRRVTKMLRDGYEPYFDDQPWGPSLDRLAGEVFSGDGVDWLKVWVLTPDRSMEEVTGVPRYPIKYGYLLDDIQRFLGVVEENVDLVTYVKYTTSGVSAIVGNDRYYAQNPGIHMFVWQFAPDQYARDPTPDFMYVNAIRAFFDRREIFYHEWCPPGKDCSGQFQGGSCSRRATPGLSGSGGMVAKRQDPADGEPADSPTPSATDPPNTEAAAAASPPPDVDEGDSQKGATLPIFIDDFTDPESWSPGEDAWWSEMEDAVHDYGAGAFEYFAAPDDFVNDHSSFHEFGSLPFGTGIKTMWGCTGIVIMSSKGVYTARIWETPTFVAPKDPANKRSYSEDETWDRRVKSLLFRTGYESFPEYPGHSAPSLHDLSNSTGAFSHETREWIQVQIITPEADGDKADKTPKYFKKIAKLRDLLMDILDIEKEHVKIKTYPALPSRSAGTTEGASGSAAGKANDTSDGLEANFSEYSGSNMLGIMYVPKHTPEGNETEAVESRGIRMWWDKEEYLTHLWCPPNSTVISAEKTNSSSSVVCGPSSSSSSNSNPPGERISGEVCQVILTPRLFPARDMHMDLAVDFNHIPITDDNERNLTSAGPISKHSFSTVLGSNVTIHASNTGLPKEFAAVAGVPWEFFLWHWGYTCKCDEAGCDLFSMKCCASGDCPERTCNCQDPEGNDICQEGGPGFAQCCFMEGGCGNEGLLRGPESEREPNLPWEFFKHEFIYGGENWFSDWIKDPKEVTYPPEKPFCQQGLAAGSGYNDIKKFGQDDFYWERSTVCYFDCGGTVTTMGETDATKNEIVNVRPPDLPSVPLADEDLDRYEGLSEPPFNPEVVNGTSGGGGTWTTGTGPIPTNLF
ncbi:uncharacterized protein DNG_06743 [Cephalotrichum gorgonifer]|uniref:Uncharacterized protein n=1 Tax=Cephalotrichum gorgonifer TaxID=2041049 RepID=A0AAE8N3A3_9PEZI|nr:uncharacterized protein DNG_06743 [Cephalotrichum gorgonifer]